MCKILAITNMEKVIIDSKFIGAVQKEITGYGDKDGFGYAILDESGNIFGERTATPKWFKPFISSPNNPNKPRIDALPLTHKQSDCFGQQKSKAKSMIAHGRLSTNTVNLANTHPFVGEDIALIHNGVIQDAGKMLTRGIHLKTDNDSEIAFRYWQMGGMVDVEENVSGYYALAVLDGYTKRLHVVKDSNARLHCAYCPTIDSFIFATTPEIIRGLCKKMKWKLEEIRAVLNNIHGVFDRNDCVHHEEIEPIGHRSYISSYDSWNGSEAVSKALGVPVTTDMCAPENEPVPAHKEDALSASYWDDLDDDCPPACDEFIAANRSIIRKVKG